MNNLKELGIGLKSFAKLIVINFMQTTPACQSGNEGLEQAQIFRECGFDWGEYENATSSNQQYWIVALLRELEAEGKVKRDLSSKRWRLV
jgi:hypothetical protein